MLRTVVAGGVAVVGVGLLLAPDVTSARPGGFACGRGIAAAPRALVAPPGFVLPKAGVVAPIRARPFAGFSIAASWARQRPVEQRRCGRLCQSPLCYRPADPNVYGTPDQGRRHVPRLGLPFQQKSVPSEAGGERRSPSPAAGTESASAKSADLLRLDAAALMIAPRARCRPRISAANSPTGVPPITAMPLSSSCPTIGRLGAFTISAFNRVTISRGSRRGRGSRTRTTASEMQG